MSQFDVFENPERGRQPNVPYVVVVQSEHFLAARTAVVVPLLRVATKKVTTAVNPEFEVNGERVTLEHVPDRVPANELAQALGRLSGRRAPRDRPRHRCVIDRALR
jgi:hypothetical protein